MWYAGFLEEGDVSFLISDDGMSKVFFLNALSDADLEYKQACFIKRIEAVGDESRNFIVLDVFHHPIAKYQREEIGPSRKGIQVLMNWAHIH